MSSLESEYMRYFADNHKDEAGKQNQQRIFSGIILMIIATLTYMLVNSLLISAAIVLTGAHLIVKGIRS